jgi:hypothetical protein
MKLLISIIWLIAGFFYTTADVSEEIIAALKSGSASGLVKHFEDKVSIRIINQEDVLSKSQAEANLKYFFSKHSVKNFNSPHVSSVNNNAQYITGNLETANGNFRVSILIRRNLISQFRIETDND